MVKKAVRRGRSKRRGEAYVFLYVELLSAARTKRGERARRGAPGLGG